MPPKPLNLAGQRFGRLVAISMAFMSRQGATWLCKCDCGKTAKIGIGRLRNGTTRSCGCLLRDATAERSRRHGMSETSEYNIWRGMLRRCRNPNATYYDRYGGRGIRVLYKSFQEFFSDLGPRPSTAHSVDRINSNGHYRPGNCRWATQHTQTRNSGRNRFLLYKGQCMPVVDWADKLGVKPNFIANRLRKGWSVARTLTEPKRAFT